MGEPATIIRFGVAHRLDAGIQVRAYRLAGHDTLACPRQRHGLRPHARPRRQRRRVLLLVNRQCRFQDATAQPGGNPADQRLRVHSVAGQGDLGNHHAPYNRRRGPDQEYTAEGAPVLLHRGEEAEVLQDLHRAQLRAGVRGQFHHEAVRLHAVLYAG